MSRIALGLILSVVALCWTANSTQAQQFQNYTFAHGGVVHILPYPYLYAPIYQAPSPQFRVLRPTPWPVYGGRWTVQRTQLDPMRHFFNGNGSSYSHGTSQMWGRTGF